MYVEICQYIATYVDMCRHMPRHVGLCCVGLALDNFKVFLVGKVSVASFLTLLVFLIISNCFSIRMSCLFCVFKSSELLSNALLLIIGDSAAIVSNAPKAKQIAIRQRIFLIIIVPFLEWSLLSLSQKCVNKLISAWNLRVCIVSIA